MSFFGKAAGYAGLGAIGALGIAATGVAMGGLALKGAIRAAGTGAWLGGAAMKGKFGATAAGAAWGGAAGAGWGALSDDTSVLGGAMMGAGMGAAGTRYGMAGMKAWRQTGNPGVKGMPAWPFGERLGATGAAMASRFSADYKGTRLMANKAANIIRGLY